MLTHPDPSLISRIRTVYFGRRREKRISGSGLIGFRQDPMISFQQASDDHELSDEDQDNHCHHDRIWIKVKMFIGFMTVSG